MGSDTSLSGKRKQKKNQKTKTKPKKKKQKLKTKALTGFEPVISCLLDRRFNQLSHRARHVRWMYKLVYDCRVKHLLYSLALVVCKCQRKKERSKLWTRWRVGWSCWVARWASFMCCVCDFISFEIQPSCKPAFFHSIVRCVWIL